jgi:hypothetical protein
MPSRVFILRCSQQIGPSSAVVIRSGSNACVQDFARNANAAQRRRRNCAHLALTLRNRGRYIDLPAHHLSALTDSIPGNGQISIAAHSNSSLQGDVL